MISDEEKFMSATLSVNEPEFAAYVALDWGDTEHAWSLEEAGGGKREQGKLRQTPEAIEAWATELAARFGGRPVAVALEQSRGALIYSLQKFSHLVFYPIHPSTSSKYRAAMFPSGSKDDPVDGDLLLDLLVRHRDRLRPLRADSPETRKLQSLVEKRRQLVDVRRFEFSACSSVFAALAHFAAAAERDSGCGAEVLSYPWQPLDPAHRSAPGRDPASQAGTRRPSHH
jgi:hypothetical protein